MRQRQRKSAGGGINLLDSGLYGLDGDELHKKDKPCVSISDSKQRKESDR